MARPRRFRLTSEAYESLARRLERRRLVLGYAAESCRTHYLQAVEFLAWLETRGTVRIAEVTAAEVRGYYEHVATRPSENAGPRRSEGGALSEEAVGAHVRAVRDLMAMLHEAGEIATDPASAVRWRMSPGATKAGQRVALTQEQVRALYAAAESARERAVLSLAYGCGLRVGEMTALNVADVRIADGVVVVERGKGGRRRTVPMSAGVAEDLAGYIASDRAWWLEVGEADTPALIVGDRGERMRKWTYNKRLRALGERAGLEDEDGRALRLTCHMLRHAIATHLLERGMAMQQIQRFLGHRHLETTQTYTHVTAAVLARLIE